MSTHNQVINQVIIKSPKYKIYIANGDIYTRKNQFIKTLPEPIVDYIIENREQFYKYQGYKRLHYIIEHTEEFLVPDVSDL